MKIAIDARWIFPQLSGVGVYTQELIRHLARMDRTNEYFLFFQHRSVLEHVAELTRFNTAPNFFPHLLPYGPFSIRNQLQLPDLLTDMKLEIFHSPNYMIPFRAFPKNRPGHVRCVITIHDLIPLLFPHYAPRALKTRFFPLYRRVMREAAARADVILTVSECSRRDIIRALNIPAQRHDRVRVVPNGVSAEHTPPVERIEGEKTILYVGRFDPYKNLVLLIEAFGRLRAGPVPDARLQIIGPPDSRYPEAPRRATELGLDPFIEWCGYVSGPELLEAYQQAGVLVLPSRYEGFGLPVLEAMACGTPVICSNASSLPEVAGDATLLVSPDDADALLVALTRVWTEPGLAQQLRERGLQQAKKFTWLRAAELTLAAYQQALSP